MTSAYQSLSHSKYECKYQVVFVPKYRRKARGGELRRKLGAIFHELARQKECQIIEGHLMPDHVHMHSLVGSLKNPQGQGFVAFLPCHIKWHKARRFTLSTFP